MQANVCEQIFVAPTDVYIYVSRYICRCQFDMDLCFWCVCVCFTSVVQIKKN